MSEIRKIMDAIGGIKATKWWVHESVVCKMSNIRPREGKAIWQWLTLVLLSLKKSYIGNKKDGIKTGRPAIDLKSRESNELNIHCLEHGQRELFFMTGDLKAAETTVTAVPRYFSFGQDVIDIKLQMSILWSVTGEDPYLDRETAINRGSLWKGWYLNKARESWIKLENLGSSFFIIFLSSFYFVIID